MYRITETQYLALTWAINNAENPGACRYTAGCVVGKLCDFYKVPYPKHDELLYNITNKTCLNLPVDLLNVLQSYWDKNLIVDDCDVLKETLDGRRSLLLDILNKLVEIKKEVVSLPILA